MRTAEPTSTVRSRSADVDCPREWWRDSIGYLIYLRSFADTTANGVGDLPGVLRHLDHLVDLGVNLVWLTPFFPSPMADFGYDVAEYEDVDPMYGSLADVDHLVDQFHARDIRVILDLVPNHTSINHPWFQESRRSRASSLRRRYVWADARSDGGPPNNWVNYFGGPAWTWDVVSQQYYLHLFLPEQPDLNWRDPTLADDFDRILLFWLDRGADGFRIDVAQALMKDAALRSNPVLDHVDMTSNRAQQWGAFRHDHDVLQPESLEIFQRWKALCQERNAVLIGETYTLEPAEYGQLLNGNGLDSGFWFKPLHIEWNKESILESLQQPLEVLEDAGRVSWLCSSQDLPRGPTRLGGGDLGRERSLLLAMLMFSLPGLPFLYQGEELGLTDGFVGVADRVDPVANSVDPGRDGCRTPMPWKPGADLGFSEAEHPWLPIGQRTDEETASWQRRTDSSWFARYRQLVLLRRNEESLRSVQEIEWIESPGQVIRFDRGDLHVIANVGDDTEVAEVAGVVLFNTHAHLEKMSSQIRLAPRQGLVVRVPGS